MVKYEIAGHGGWKVWKRVGEAKLLQKSTF